jgi:hypothetical protein
MTAGHREPLILDLLQQLCAEQSTWCGVSNRRCFTAAHGALANHNMQILTTINYTPCFECSRLPFSACTMQNVLLSLVSAPLHPGR